MNALTRRVPDVGETFEHDGSRYRVTGWLRRDTRAHFMMRDVGPDNCPLRHCLRDHAEYVTGYGVCGVIVRVSDVTVTGKVSWSDAQIEELRARAVLSAGRAII